MLSRSSRGRLKKDVGVRAVAWTAGMSMSFDAESSAKPNADVDIVIVLGYIELGTIQTVATR